MLQHILEDYITAVNAVVGIQTGIIVCGGFEHSYKYGSLFWCQVLRGGVEVGLASGLDAKGVGAEVDGISIHRQDFFFAEVGFQFDSGNPFLGLHDQHLDAGNIAEQSCGVFRADTEEILGQLLCDG